MQEIIDILTLSEADCPNFVVDNTVQPSKVVTVTTPTLQSSNGAVKFKKGDNFQILSIGLRSPESFIIAPNPTPGFPALPIFSLIPIDLTQSYSNPNSIGGYFLPMESYELVIDAFFNCSLAKGQGLPANQTLLQNDFSLQCSISNLWVSMVGVPSSLNASKFYFVPFVKVKHNFPMF